MIDETKLLIYQRAKELEKEVRGLVRRFPKIEEYCLKKQLKTAVNSVGANIVEGAGRRTKTDFIRFLANSTGSLKETRYHLEMAQAENYVSEGEFIQTSIKIDELGRMLNSFITGLKN
jgi:four helix bundle protein